jgi:hypothetical protein
MSFAIVAGLLAAGTAVSVYGQVEAGKAQQESLERQAEEEKLAAEARELQRRQELNKVLAANAVSMAAGGVSGVTPESIALESAKQVSASEGMMAVSDKLKQAQLRRQGAMARSTANIGATSTLLSSAGKIASGYQTYQANKVE